MSYFNHEQLDVYKLAVQVARSIAKARFPRGDADLRDQALRSSRSVVLNIAEGRSRGGRAEKNHYRIALGSAAETCAALDLTTIANLTTLQENLRRIGAMLNVMAR